jgi:hypothetical protein
MTKRERQAIVASLITDLNQKSFESLTKVLNWVSEDSSHEALFKKATEIIQDKYQQTWDWLNYNLEKLNC